jgi:hypothetical protein
VEFAIDGIPVGPPSVTPPFTATLNSWRFDNGNHLIEVKAYDAFGNVGIARHRAAIRNVGSMPALPDKIVFDETIHSPFTNTSWGAAVDLNNHALARDGSTSVKVDFLAWGAFDVRSGAWGADSPLDPTEFDTLKADIYPMGSVKLKASFYNGYSVEIPLLGQRWHCVAIPLAFSRPFDRFYFQNEESRPVTCYFDNVRFTAKRYLSAARN